MREEQLKGLIRAQKISFKSSVVTAQTPSVLMILLCYKPHLRRSLNLKLKTRSAMRPGQATMSSLILNNTKDGECTTFLEQLVLLLDCPHGKNIYKFLLGASLNNHSFTFWLLSVVLLPSSFCKAWFHTLGQLLTGTGRLLAGPHKALPSPEHRSIDSWASPHFPDHLGYFLAELAALYVFAINRPQNWER